MKHIIKKTEVISTQIWMLTRLSINTLIVGLFIWAFTGCLSVNPLRPEETSFEEEKEKSSEALFSIDTIYIYDTLSIQVKGADTIFNPVREQVPEYKTLKFETDFSGGSPASDMSVTTSGCDNNPTYKGSYRMLYPGTSRIRLSFNVPEKPVLATITVTHLSSAWSGDPTGNGGWSPVNMSCNGDYFERKFDTGSHSYVTHSWNITDYTDWGYNLLQWDFDDNANTHYWLKKVTVTAQYPTN